ncbi:MAG: hypothetical protein ACKVUS_07395 [Saprospiraceae bacterium]
MTIYSVYDEIAELLAQLAPGKILALKASGEMQERLEFLIEKSKEDQLTIREKDELDHYIVLERLVRLSKIRAHAA